MLNGGRIWLLIGGIVGAGIIALGWLVAASPLFAQADLADAQRADVEAVNLAEATKLAEMKALDSRKDELLDEYDTLKESVPATHDLEGYFDWVATASTTAGVTLGVATVTDVSPYEDDPDSIGTVVLDPEFQKSLRVVSVSIAIGGNADQMSDFLHLLQTDGRLQLITKTSLKLGTQLTGAITGYIFVIDDPKLVALNESLTSGGDAGESDGSGDGESAEGESTETPAPSDTPTPENEVEETPSARG